MYEQDGGHDAAKPFWIHCCPRAISIRSDWLMPDARFAESSILYIDQGRRADKRLRPGPSGNRGPCGELGSAVYVAMIGVTHSMADLAPRIVGKRQMPGASRRAYKEVV